jgi:hypothetical protein
MVEVTKLNYVKTNKLNFALFDFIILTLMLGLLLAFSKMVKFAVVLVQKIIRLTSNLNEEMETIERGSNHKVFTKNGYYYEKSEELNNTALFLNKQIEDNQITLLLFLLVILFVFVILYFALDFLLGFAHKFKPWSVVLLVVTFIASVLYFEFEDLRSTGDGFTFMFSTIISIITGTILVGYSLIYPNFRPLNTD